jgi:glycosyltransferase involved in cell wall biosynthesis
MAVSVIMPVYNSARVVSDQLDALIDQDYTGDWELVIADNGCTDSTVEIALAYTDRLPLRVVQASERRGDVAARNIAVPETSGDLIVFCDSDDIVSSSWLSSHVDQLGVTELSIGPYDMRVEVSDHGDDMYVAVPMHGVYRFLPYGLSANMGVRRDAFDNIGGFDEEFRVGYDVEFCWRAQIAHLRLGAVEHAMVTKRKRGDASGAFDQHRAFGISDVHLYLSYRRYGMPRSLNQALRAYAWLVIHVADLANKRQRLRWIGVAGQRAGRIIGSIERRTLYL